MSARKLLSVDDIPFVGGSLCVDFVNTSGARGTDQERERFERYSDVLVWGLRAGLITGDQESALREIATRRQVAARRALARIRSIRESLYRVFRAVTEASRASTADVELLSRLARLERQRYQLTPGETGYLLAPRGHAGELDGLIWPVVASAVELLTSPRVSKLRRCGECDWLFVDDSKNRSRLWCKTECGDRVRARRHYSRKK